MGNNKVVTIIVPVFNAKEKLRKCIDSILNQSYKDIELILVNDGSTDGSLEICNEYAQYNSKIKVIHQDNSGPSVARNVGINAASGYYIQFVDADDYVDPNMTERLIQLIHLKDVQLGMCGYKTIYINKENLVAENHIPCVRGVYRNAEFMRFFGEFFEENFIHSPCNKLYIRNIIEENNIKFVEKINMGEDLLFNLDYINICDSISVIDEPLYNYMKHNDINSLTGSFKNELFDNQQFLFNKTRKFLIDRGCYKDKNLHCLELIYTDRIVDCFENLFHIKSNLKSKQIQQQIYNIIHDNTVRSKIVYFKGCNIQKDFIRLLIKLKCVYGIYIYFKLKNILRLNIRPLFNVLKLATNKKTKQTSNSTIN